MDEINDSVIMDSGPGGSMVLRCERCEWLVDLGPGAHEAGLVFYVAADHPDCAENIKS